MQLIQLHALPEPHEEPWTVDFFCEKIDTVCRNAASELHKKSLMVEEAVEEILELMKRTKIDDNSDVGEIFLEGNCSYL